MTPEREIRHLEHGAAPGETPAQLGTVRFEIDCPGNAELVLKRAKEVLRVVIEGPPDRWPTDDEWRLILPEWFVVTCTKEVPKAESDKWLDWWRKLKPDQKAKAEAQKKWSVPAWIYWFHPDQRAWFWWDSEILSSQLVCLAIQVSSWPFPWGALRWLFIAAGATEVRAEN